MSHHHRHRGSCADLLKSSRRERAILANAHYEAGYIAFLQALKMTGNAKLWHDCLKHLKRSEHICEELKDSEKLAQTIAVRLKILGLAKVFGKLTELDESIHAASQIAGDYVRCRSRPPALAGKQKDNYLLRPGKIDFDIRSALCLAYLSAEDKEKSATHLKALMNEWEKGTVYRSPGVAIALLQYRAWYEALFGNRKRSRETACCARILIGAVGEYLEDKLVQNWIERLVNEPVGSYRASKLCA